jgi:hypothetical protein
MNGFVQILIIPVMLYGSVLNGDNSSGFEGFRFGTPKEAYRNLTLEVEEGNSRLYTVSPNEIKIDGVQLESIRLTFINNKLSVIALSTKNATGLACLSFLREQYGNPVNNKRNQYCWKKTDMNIVFELSKNKKDAYIDFYGK